ncbi:hypothetical protein TNCV_1043981 [Trichonephila clavipes]|nr:hypothetical protein TNCV_1043981 [Trichonephila clavipes]
MVWEDLDFRIDVCRVTRFSHKEYKQASPLHVNPHAAALNERVVTCMCPGEKRLNTLGITGLQYCLDSTQLPIYFVPKLSVPVPPMHNIANSSLCMMRRATLRLEDDRS